jgi:hypothetical protein
MIPDESQTLVAVGLERFRCQAVAFPEAEGEG